jgi:hypothetical protein
MNTILAVQPGLTPSVALFEMAGWQRSEQFDRVLARLRMTDVIRTAPSEPLPVRLRALAGGLDRILAGARNSLWAVSLIYIEQPSGNQHRGRRGISAAQLSLVWLASGALITAAVARGVAVRLVRAPTLARKVRHRSVLSSLPAAERRADADVLDAIWLGATCITSPKYQPQSRD